MSAPRIICVVTGSRADYGLLRSLLHAIHADRRLRLQVVATGTHLSPEFGMTSREIEADGFIIDARVDLVPSVDTPLATAKAMGQGVAGFAEVLSGLRPDILVVLGDRYEIFAAAQAALLLRIAVAHVHGGELSEGAFDDSIRHALTKIAQWHFVAAAPYRARVIQMGEPPDHVFDVGAPGLDQLATIRWLDRSALQDALGITLGSPLLLVAYHPATLSDADPAESVSELLAALEDIRDGTVVFTFPNADPRGLAVRDRLAAFVAALPARRYLFASLGQQRYLSLMRLSDVVVGNSSSGLIEAPALHTASVNVGERQKGRLKAGSVIDADEQRDDITRAIRRAMSDDFRRRLTDVISLYGVGNAAAAIVEQLATVPLQITKSFFDLPHEL